MAAKKSIKFHVNDHMIEYGEYESLDEAMARIRELIIEDLVTQKPLDPGSPDAMIRSHHYGIEARF